MMRNCKPPGNRAGESMAASRTGTDELPPYQKVRRFPGYAGIIAVAVVTILVAWCDLTQAAGTARVILLRGWFGVFSTGLDTLTDELKGLGINAEVAGHLSWQNEIAEILRERAAGRTGPLILVGHSQGANNVIDMARALEQSHITVDLLITLSPFMQNSCPRECRQSDQLLSGARMGAAAGSRA